MYNLFVYGELLDSSTLVKLISRVPDTRAGVIKGYRKFMTEIDNDTWTFAVPDPNCQVNGMYLLLSMRELAILDMWEGQRYMRIAINDDTYIYIKNELVN